MKKIYTLISVLTLSYASIAQVTSFENAVLDQNPQQAYAPKKIKTISNTNIINARTTGGPIQGRFDPAFALPTARMKTIGPGAGDNIGTYVSPMFADSTSKQSFSGSVDKYITTHKAGMVFDPTSIIFDPIGFTPLLSSADSYILDTVWIGGVYRRVNSINDTLNIEIVWSDTTTASAAFSKYTYAAPLNSFGTFIGCKYTSNNTQKGDRIRLSAPGTNKIVIKRILTNADTAYLNANSYLPIVVNGLTGQTIPAGNKVACTYAFISGNTTFSVGSVSYSGGSTAPTPASVNGWATPVYSQKNPIINTLADVDNGFDDYGVGKNSAVYVYKNGRYNFETGLFATTMRNGFTNAVWIDFSIRGNSTVGINKVAKNDFKLGQNTPNPFSNGSTVRFELVKDAKSVLFIITDVMGRVVSTQNVANTTGINTVNIPTLSAGVYYYTLNVDGKSTTKKMIAQ